MKNARIGSAWNSVKNLAIAMALLGCWATWLAPQAAAQANAFPGYAVGNNGTILHTANATQNGWAVQPSPVQVQLNAAASFGNGTSAWIVGNTNNGAGTILFTNTAGAMWTPANGILNVNLNSVYAGDASNVWAVGNSGTILYFDGTAWNRQTPNPNTTANLLGVYMIKVGNHYQGWAVGANGTVVYTNDGRNWVTPTMQQTGIPNNQGSFNAVSGKLLRSPDVESRIFNIVFVAVGDRQLGMWRYSTFTNRWQRVPAPGGAAQDMKAVKNLTATNYWLGQTSNRNVFNWLSQNNAKTGNWVNRSFANLGSVSGLSVLYTTQAWAVGANGLAYWHPNGNANPWTLQVAGVPQLNGIAVLKPLGGGAPVQLSQLTSPGSGASDENYVSLTGSDFPDGNITPGNVVIDLSVECGGDVAAETSAVSVVSNPDGSKTLSFLVPNGLDPGAYYISVIDFEQGDANFRSSNCSTVTVVK